MSTRGQPSAQAPFLNQRLLELRVLGALEVRRTGQPLPLGGAQPRALLALLCIHRGTLVPADRIVDDLWGESPPRTAGHMVEIYVSKLRKLLGREAIETRAGAYRLALSPEQIDRERFERLLAEGEEALPHDPALASVRLAQALSLWRGPALADVAYEPFAQAEIARLEELRLRAEEARIEADLSLGRGAELVGDLEAFVAQAPLRERLHALLMRALYQAGRQADALAAYRKARTNLLEELGLAPGPELRGLERAILAQEPTLIAPPRPAPAVRNVRKTVTVLFCDLVESSALASCLDPEALQAVLDGYFQAAAAAIERHGGVVEKFIGDAVVAIFGAPIAREDDPLRAARAACEITAAVAELGERLEREHSLRLAVRVGVNTGEVIARDPADRQALVTGDAVTIAARLQEATEAGSVALSATTGTLLAHAARLEPLSPVAVAPGRPSIGAFRLVELLTDAPALPRRFDAALVGRKRELAHLRRAYRLAVRKRRAVFVTIIGEPGIGKTRLARELAASVRADARVVVTRFPPYGEGSTLAVLRDLVCQAAGAEEAEAIRTLLTGEEEAPAIAERIDAALGLTDRRYPQEEIFWATRRLLEAVACERPLLLVLDDLHWGEPGFLDLLEHVAEHACAPILLLCLARPELREERPNWFDTETTLVLPTLSLGESAALVNNLAHRHPLLDEDRARILPAAEGNPLFLEQLVAFAAETSGASDVPPTLEALLASRLDRIGPAERTVLEAAAIAGREFATSAVVALLPPELAQTAPRHLGSLTHKDLLAPERPLAPFSEAARFRHVLIRDTAYRSIAKAHRAELHERLADWLAEAPAPLRGDDETIGYHLEQAYRYQKELGQLGKDGYKRGAEAADRFGRAARRASMRGDEVAAANLFERGVALLPDEAPERAELLLGLGEALVSAGELTRIDEALAEAQRVAHAVSDRRLEWRATVLGCQVEQEVNSEVNVEVTQQTAEQAIAALEQLGDEGGLSRAWLLLVDVFLMSCRFAAMREAAEHALAHARRAGDGQLEAISVSWVGAALEFGPTPAPQALAELERLVVTARRTGNRLMEAYLYGNLASQHAISGAFSTARTLLGRARRLINELGTEGRLPHFDCYAALIDLLAGNPSAAEASFRSGYEGFRRARLDAHASTYAAELANTLYLLGRNEEAEEFTTISEKTAASGDVASQVKWRGVRAKVLARRGAYAEAEILARDGIALAAKTDALTVRGDSLMDFADVLRLADRSEEAVPFVREALRFYEKKGNVVSARNANVVLDHLAARGRV